MRFIAQVAALRFGRMSRFAVIGGIGAIATVLIMAGLISLGVEYIVGAVIAALLTIVANFFLQEQFVFKDLPH
ncbi:GtrA family protein, partial [Rhizobium johnstonii]|uniref:GtrA family protein n=1 Tax=Rhizobium johnstonii TaxID=3019933 RepID=UPI003F94FF10